MISTFNSQNHEGGQKYAYNELNIVFYDTFLKNTILRVVIQYMYRRQFKIPVFFARSGFFNFFFFFSSFYGFFFLYFSFC